MLKPIGRFNNFPKDYVQPRLQKDEVVNYRLINSVPDPENPKLQRYPASVKLKNVDTVRVDDSGDVYEAGLIRTVTKEGLPDSVSYIIIPAQANFGYLRIVGGSIQSNELFSFLEISNENESNPFRDTDIPAKFRRIDVTKQSKNDRKARSEKLSAMNVAENMNLTTVKQFAASRNWDEHADPEVLRNMVEKLAEENPALFIKYAMDKDIEIKATIKRAIDNGVIEFNRPQSKWVWKRGGETIAVVARVEGTEPFDALCDFVKTHKNGNAIYDAILRGARKQVVEVTPEVATELGEEVDTNEEQEIAADAPTVNKGGRPRKL